MIKIEPAVEGLNIYPSGNYVYIQGYKKGRTTYKVTVDGSISDTFGQSLGTAGNGTDQGRYRPSKACMLRAVL